MEFHEDGYASFGGLAYENISLDECDIIIQGIPYDSASSSKKGSARTPAALRLQSAELQIMSRTGKDIEQVAIRDMGNIPVFPLSGKQTRESIEKSMDFLLEKSEAPVISIGGDHSISYPLIKSMNKKGKTAIIWFDAHRDILPELMGSKYSYASPLLRSIELENVDASNVLLVGTRYLTHDEQKILEQYQIPELRMVDLEDMDFDLTKFQEKVRSICHDVEHVYLSIDIDVLDPAFAPGTGTPVAGGLTSAQLLRLIGAIPVKIRAADITEVSPTYDHSGITIQALMGILTELITQLVNN